MKAFLAILFFTSCFLGSLYGNRVLQFEPTNDNIGTKRLVLGDTPYVKNLYKGVTANKIFLTYDLIGEKDVLYNVKVYYVLGDYRQIIESAIGDIGDLVKAGNGNKIEIDYKAEGIKSSEAYKVKFEFELIPQGPVANSESALQNDSLSLYLLNLITKGNKVFVISDDKGVVNHARFELRNWGYWNVVDNEADADFILRFNFSIGIITSTAFAEFIDPKDHQVLSVIRKNQSIALDMNAKRGVIRMLIRQKIIKNFN